MTAHTIEKALEVWTLQNFVNFSIILGFLALGLSIVQNYYKSIEKKLTLKVSIELWNVLTIIVVDLALVVIVVVGYMVMNPDIMADIKIAIPFVPVATILFTIALVIRLFYKGSNPENKTFMLATWFMFFANILNIIGFTFIMEAPSGEYLENHPSLFWTFIKTHLRSNANPAGLELSQITFYICFPIMTAVLIWGFVSGIRQLKNRNKE